MIDSFQKAILHQIEIEKFLISEGIKDLVQTTEGYDILHSQLGRIQVKTRKYERTLDGKVRKEDRAVGFDITKPNQFDWLCHIVLDIDYSLVGATLVEYKDVWPYICEKTRKGPRAKVSFAHSSSRPSSNNIFDKVNEEIKCLISIA